MTVAELINELQNYPSHSPVRILGEQIDETVGIREVLHGIKNVSRDYDTDDKLVVIIKPY